MIEERPARGLRIVMLGPFGLGPKMTMRRRALPAARALAARGHAVTLILPPWQTPDEAGRAWDDEVAGVRIVNVALGGLGVPILGHAIVAARMARAAMALEPDVVHAFKPKAYSGLAATMLWLWRGLRRGPGRGGGFRLIVDTDDWEGRGGWNDLERYSRAQRAVFALQERWGLTHADHVTVASRALEGLVWAMGVPPGHVTYVPNAVDDIDAVSIDDATSGNARHAPVDQGPRVRLAAGNDVEHLSLPTLLLYTRFFEFALARPLDVLALVRARIPNARLVVAGTGLFGEERRFAELAARRGLAEAVAMRGWLEPAAAAATFAESDAALYPFDDTLINRTKSPFKLLELMAAGLPVIAEAVGECREIVVDGLSGRVVPTGDVRAMADAAVAVLTDAALRARLGAGARARVGDAYAWSARVAALEAAYASAPAQGGTGTQAHRSPPARATAPGRESARDGPQPDRP